MRFWWVNQNQTFKQEFDGGYLWSPKRKANGHRNAFYDYMRDVAPGDIVFSFKATLPTKYSPLHANGKGLQSVYLAAIPEAMAHVLVGLVGHQARVMVDQLQAADLASSDPGQIPEEVTRWEEHLVSEIQTMPSISDTERKAVITARRGQGQFRQNVAKIEKRCRVTRVGSPYGYW